MTIVSKIHIWILVDSNYCYAARIFWASLHVKNMHFYYFDTDTFPIIAMQPEFFGLRYMSKRPYPKVRWVELDRPLKKQLDKYAQSPALSLSVVYYIHDIGLLQDDTTRSHFFLQVFLPCLNMQNIYLFMKMKNIYCLIETE